LAGADPVTPFWPGISLAETPEAGTAFLDRQHGSHIQPACLSTDYEAAYDEHGYPRPRHLADTLRVVVPSRGPGDTRVIESLAQQVIRGFSVDWMSVGPDPLDAPTSAGDVGIHAHRVADLAAMIELASRPGAESGAA